MKIIKTIKFSQSNPTEEIQENLTTLRDTYILPISNELNAMESIMDDEGLSDNLKNSYRIIRDNFANLTNVLGETLDKVVNIVNLENVQV